jgi:hypothetical protein
MFSALYFLYDRITNRRYVYDDLQDIYPQMFFRYIDIRSKRCSSSIQLFKYIPKIGKRFFNTFFISNSDTRDF